MNARGDCIRLGIPLPLMSYGISSLTTNILAIAILLNIHMHKQKFIF